MNVFSLFENAVATWGDRTAVRCGARRQTYRELDAAAAAFSGYLASLGLAPGDRVAVFMQNGLLYPAVSRRLRRRAHQRQAASQRSWLHRRERRH
jgi:acyl-CoA synthetase (AMP-forming)/AMP-acid ligase II